MIDAVDGARLDLGGRARPHLLAVARSRAGLANFGRFTAANEVDLEHVPDVSTALRALSNGHWDALLLVLDGEPEDELRAWIELVHRLPRPPRVIALVSTPSIGLALRVAQLGVFEVLSLQAEDAEIQDVLRRVRVAADESVLPLPDVLPVAIGPHHLVSESPTMLPVFRTIAQVAGSAVTVIVAGESGTGKELVARAIHFLGPRRTAPFIAINCAAIPENLLESELFGHDKGAFTGAIARKIGRFERASGGTLFLDEIGDMSLALQAKILRAIQEREIERVGGTTTIPVDVRLIAATNRDLKDLIGQGRFREDLYYRLAVVTIKLPPLAERDHDLLLLTASFLREFGPRYGKEFRGISDQALELLRRHQWVGNVRELRNVIERAVLIADGEVLRAEHLPEDWRRSSSSTPEDESRSLATIQEVEARHIARVMRHTQGQIGEAARVLGVHRNTLARKIRSYGL